MSQNHSTKRIKCADFLNKHNKICYKSDSVRFKQFENLVHLLKLLYPDLPLTPSTYLCRRCYEHALELMTSTDNEFSTDDYFIDNGIDRDEDFLPSTPEHVGEFNNKISTFFSGCVSPLKRKNLIREKSIENSKKEEKKTLLTLFMTFL